MSGPHLEPCPFCGGEPILIQNPIDFPGRVVGYVQCKVCRARGPEVSVVFVETVRSGARGSLAALLIEKWNARAEASAAAAPPGDLREIRKHFAALTQTGKPACVHCKWFQPRGSCRRPNLPRDCMEDHVLGRRTEGPTRESASCHTERTSLDAGSCGRDARFFEPKLTERQVMDLVRAGLRSVSWAREQLGMEPLEECGFLTEEHRGPTDGHQTGAPA